MSLVQKSLDGLDRLTRIILVVMVMTILALAIYQVFTRSIISLPFSTPWTEEVSRYLFIWIVMLASSVLVREKSHATITLFINKLPTKSKMILEIIIFMICMIFIGVLFYQGILMTIEMLGQASPSGVVPMSLVYLSLPVGSLLMLLYFVELIFMRLSELRK